MSWGIGYGTGGRDWWPFPGGHPTGGIDDPNTGGPGRDDPNYRPNPHLQRLLEDRAQWRQAHDYGGVPQSAAMAEERAAGVMPGDARRNIRNARQGNFEATDEARSIANPAQLQAYDALETLRDDYAPLREARSAFRDQRDAFRSADPGMRGDMRDDLRGARQTFRQTRRGVVGAERRGMTGAEYGARGAGRSMGR